MPDVGCDPLPLPPHAASNARPPTHTVQRMMRLARGAVKSRKIPSKGMSARVIREMGHLSCISTGMLAAADETSTADDGRAVVVTVSVVPEIEQLPAGIEQVAVRVGFVLKPLSLNWKVKAVPADPDCEGCDGVTVGPDAVNVAVTLVFAVSENEHTGFVLPTQAPDQFVNVAPVFGTAVSVIEVPEVN